MVYIAILVDSNNHIQSDDKCVKKVIIDNQQTVYDYMKILTNRYDISKYNAYMYNNKCLGYDIPITYKICSIFGLALSVVLREVAFTVPMNPFKHVNWIMILHERNLFDIINLEGDDPINKESIGTWHTWGKVPHLLDKNMDNHPDNLVIIYDAPIKIAYNKFQLRELINVTSGDTIMIPHSSKRIRKSVLIEQLNMFDGVLPLISI